MRAAERSWRGAVLELIGFLVLPFVVLFWLAPYAGDAMLGADFARYTLPQQILLQFSLANGTWPLYVPGFAGGQGASAATLGQLHHPISHLAALLPGYWDGRAVDAYTLLCLLSIGFTHWAAHRLLRELALDVTLAFVVSFVTVFNLRMLALFDYGAALQAWVGSLLLCVAMARVLLHGGSVARFACVVGATYLLLCSGHPQMAYLGALGAGIALLCMTALLPAPSPSVSWESSDRRRRTVVRAATCVAGVAAGTLLSAAYLLPFVVDFLANAVQRTGQDFAWVYTPFGTHSVVSLLHSVLRPFSSDVQGTFGGPALLAVPLLLPVVALVRRPSGAALLTWIAALLVLALALAETLPLYHVAWKLLPMFASFRAPGRVTIMVPFLLLLLLAWLCRAERVPLRFGGRSVDVAPLAAVAAIAAVAYAAYALAATPQLDALELVPPLRIADIPAAATRGVWLLGVASLALLAWYAQRPGRVVAALLVVAVVAQTTTVLRFGTWVAAKNRTTTWSELVDRHRRAIGFGRGDPGAGMVPAILVERQAALGSAAPTPPMARLYWDVRLASSRSDAFASLRAALPDRATLEDGSGAVMPPGDDPWRDVPPSGRVRLQLGNFNRFVLRVWTNRPALLVLGQPFSRNWQARVNDDARAVGVANGAFVGVGVPAGESLVELRYDPAAARVGVWLTIGTAWLLVAAAATRLRRMLPRVLLVATATLLAISAAAAWQRNLFTGRHLGTFFEWQTPRSDAPPAARPVRPIRPPVPPS